MDTQKVWFVTGASKGLGLHLVKKLLRDGYRVAATSRIVQSLKSEAGEVSETFLPLEVDLAQDENVKNAIEQTVAHFGRIDVVVNNAGFGQIGTLEELTAAEVQQSFNINVFGALHVTRHAMPYFRAQQSGHVFNISSAGGFFGTFPGWGIYCATKFAMAGFTESFAEEVKEFGVKATVVYPGTFKTDFLTKGSIKTAQHSIPDYKASRDLERIYLEEINGNQANDPEIAPEVLIAISNEENPPVHLLLGKDSYDILQHKIALITKDAEQWKELSFSTSY